MPYSMNKKSLKLLFIIIFLSLGLLSAEARRKPVIGIAPGYSGANSSIVNRSYTDAVYRAGGIPVILPQVNDEAAAAEIEKKLQDNWQSKYNVIKNYSPEQVAIIESAKVDRDGLYVSLVISADADKIKEMFKEGIK